MSTWKAIDVDYKDIDWEQRRYEIAKDAMCALIGRQSAKDAAEGRGQSLIEYASEMAISYADALIEELKR